MALPTLLLAAFLLGIVPVAAIDCPSCNDVNFCTIDSCDTTTGTCRHVPRDCDDGNPCTTDSCTHLTYQGFGQCNHLNRPAGTQCDDGNSCSLGDACNSAGSCVGGQQIPGTACSDANACTTGDTCDTSGQCVGTVLPAGASCDDGSACTSGDTCAPDPGGAIVCQGSSTNCDDANPCTQDTCDPATGQCSHPNVDCNDGNVCTTDTCDPAAGGCVRTPASGSCNTGHFCTVGESCSGGNCLLGSPKNCNDNVYCTVDTCNDTGYCDHRPDDSLCGPDGPCYHGECRPLPLPINGLGCSNTQRSGFFNCDGNVCKPDQCSAGFCLSPTGPPTTEPCDDHNPCTTNDLCGVNYECHGTPVSCDDADACTTDSCNATGQCVHQPTGGGGTCGVGACLRTVTCPAICVPGTSTPELCNGVDDDCNGLTDDLGMTSCGVGACARTVANCLNGVPQTCVPGSPATEVCNGLDDDCNGLTDELGTTTCGVGACTRTVAYCLNGEPQTCIPGTPSAEVCNSLDDNCNGEVDEGSTTCGVGACQRTIDNCVDAQDQACVPGDPAPEQICNAIDDDCDGSVDEGRIQADCTINPSTLNLNAQGSTFNIECKFLDLCDPNNPMPIPGAQIETVYISRADSAASSSDDTVLPDPSSLPCPDPVLGSLYERGIVEDPAARQNTPKGATFKFDVTNDGTCETLDGDRRDLAASLTGIPDNTSATICLSGKANGVDFTGCTTALIKNRGLR